MDITSVLDAVTRVALGFVIGTFGTLIGAGGGFILVPLLLLGYHFPPADAVGTSLSLVFLNALSGSTAYLRQRRVDLALGWRFALATLPGAIGGAYVTRSLSSRSFAQAFGVLLIGSPYSCSSAARRGRPRALARASSSTRAVEPITTVSTSGRVSWSASPSA